MCNLYLVQSHLHYTTLHYTTLKDLPIILRGFEQPFGFYMSLRCSKLISLNCEGAKNCILIQLHAINSQGKAVNLRNTDKKGGGSNLTVSLTVRCLIFLLVTFLRADAEMIIFGEICTPGAGGIGWYRAKVIMALKNLLGLLGASIVHKYGHDNQKSD